MLVDAELIGLTQSVQSFVGGKPNLSPGAAGRPISAADAKPTGVGAETDEGTAIDQSTTNPNPIYAVENPDSTSLTDAANAEFGEHGWRYKDATGALQEQTAKLTDRPRRAGAAKDSRQIFETVALATKGAQAGTYYGSVRWGWRTDAAGAFTKVPLSMVSEGTPSATFLKAGEVWNASKTPVGNKATVDLPIPDVKVTQRAGDDQDAAAARRHPDAGRDARGDHARPRGPGDDRRRPGRRRHVPRPGRRRRGGRMAAHQG